MGNHSVKELKAELKAKSIRLRQLEDECMHALQYIANLREQVGRLQPLQETVNFLKKDCQRLERQAADEVTTARTMHLELIRR